MLPCGLFTSSQRKWGPPLLLSALLTSPVCSICAPTDQRSFSFPVHSCSSVVPLHRVCGALSICHVHIPAQVLHGTRGWLLIVFVLFTSSVHWCYYSYGIQGYCSLHRNLWWVTPACGRGRALSLLHENTLLSDITVLIQPECITSPGHIPGPANPPQWAGVALLPH